MVISPSYLLDSYKQYKAEMQTFITWIAETAIGCGHNMYFQEVCETVGSSFLLL